ncbi:MAG: ATP-binding protein [Verrucomicrobiota bacterium]
MELERDTERKGQAAGNELAKAETLSNSLMEFSSEGIVVLNRFGNVENINQQAQALLNTDLSSALNQAISDIFVAYEPGTDDLIDLASERYRNPQLSIAQAEVIGANGIRTPVGFQLKPNTNRQNPELSGAILFLRDLSQTVSKDAQIRLIATALKSIGEGVIITDANWEKGNARILYTNNGFAEITGYSDLEVVGKGISILNGENTDLTIIDEMVRDLKAGRTAAGETVGYRKEGSEFIMSWKIFPVYESSDKVSNYVVIQRDVSQIRRLEQDLFQSQKMEAIGRLAGGVAHDFNNILAVILSFSDLILDKTPDGDPNRKYLTEVRKAAERAADLTQQLLSFSRRNKSLKPEVLDAVKIARDMQKILRRLIPENIAFNLHFQEDPVHVNINRTALEQILINFTTNARDAMKDGGEIDFSIISCDAEESTRYLPDYMDAKPYMILSFQDTGSGIDGETQKHIFEPFFTTKELGKGTGLGLATVYGIVTQANGHIEVASEPGKGTLFRIFLPIVASVAEDKKQVDDPTSEELNSQNRETILIVEDDETWCDCISGLLVHFNYEVYSTNQAEDALDFLEDSNAGIKLLITDLILPKMRGSELAERLLKQNPEMKVIYMTGYSEEILSQFNIPEDATLLKKPFSMKTILSTVREMLQEETEA